VASGPAAGAVQPERGCPVAGERPPPEPDETPARRELGRGGRLGALVLLHLRVGRAGRNLDLEFDQELHAVLLLMASRPRFGDRGRDADVCHPARLTAPAMTAPRITPATMACRHPIRKWEAPSPS